MRRIARFLWSAGVLAGLLAGVQTLAAAPAAEARQECGCVWSWQQTMWICGCEEAGRPP